MRIFLNAVPRDVSAGSLAEALAELGLADKGAATAVNGQFVPQSRREETRLQDGDRVELLVPAQGG